MKLLMGGSPCTHWSIAQTKNRETEPSGLGWDLFLNYRISRDKYKPDYFLYENNKSMSPAIRAQITKELGVEPVLINSALVSAQSRQRLYWFGKRNQDGTYSQVDVEQPEDRRILLRDILESGVCWREKAYCLKAQYRHGIPDNDMLKRRQNNQVAEPVNITADGKAQCLRASYYKDGILNLVGNTADRKTCVPEPIRVCNIAGGSQGNRIYDVNGKSCAIKAQSGGLGGHGQGLYAVPCPILRVPEATALGYAEIAPSQCVDLTQPNSKTRRGRSMADKSNCLTTAHEYYQYLGTVDRPVCQVKDGHITIKGERYPIKLLDGYYIIRKLTVRECMRLQTVPEWYTFPVSDTQAYKMLGNGWTVEVIAHILSHIPGIAEEPVEVLSMYDGMSCGHIALDKLGANVARYYATEIDKYAIQNTMANYPNTVQLGDAFQVREDGWAV